MKKAIVLLLALVLVFGLCACTDTTQSILGERNESDEALDAPTYAMILHFTINPVFHIYLDKEQTILSVEAENEDAEVLFAQLDVVGQPYAEAITHILDTAYTQGYLKDGAQISVEIASPQPSDASIAFIDSPISKFELEHGITTDTNINLLPDPNQKSDSVVIDGQKYSVFTEPLYGGSSGEQVGTYISYTAKGLFSNFKSTGYSRKEIQQFFNGDTTITYYRNEKPLRVLTTYANGGVYDVSYHSNGEYASYYSSLSNGDFDYFVNAEDGTSLESESLQDGNYMSWKLHDDGSVHSYMAYADGSRYETTKNANGKNIYTAEYYSDGNSVVTTYDDDGTPKIREEVLDGILHISTFDEHGTLVRAERKEPDGSGTEILYNSTGGIIGWSRYDANGDYEITSCYENGKTKTIESMFGGVYNKSEHDENGNMIYSTNGKDEFFYENNIVVKAVIGGVTYTGDELAQLNSPE